MNYQTKQDELDVKKWLASEEKGADACGDFDYCACCDKNEQFPCAHAAEKKAKESKPAAKKPAAKSAAKPAAKPAAAKTTAAAKPAAKKIGRAHV